MLMKNVGCDSCVLPEGYAGYDFEKTADGSTCIFCMKFQEKDFKGDDLLRRHLEIKPEEQIGVTVRPPFSGSTKTGDYDHRPWIILS